MKSFIQWFLTISGGWAIAAVLLVPALETAVVLGAMIPGEVTVILGGVLAAQGAAPIWAILIAGVVGPMSGDTIGYFLGRRYGKTVVRRKLQKRWGPARRRLSNKSGWTIFLGRFLPFLRSILPTTAGAMAIDPRRFLSWDLPAASIWGAASVLVGYFAARDFRHVLSFLHRFALVLGGLAIAVAAWLIWRQVRRRPRK